MRLTIATLAFTVMATAAYAGGNPDEEQNGAMTREPLQSAQPLKAPIPDQYQIQREAEAEVRRGWVEMNLSAPADNDAVAAEPVKAVTIARAEQAAECASFWQAAAELLGGECYRDSNFHNPSPTGTYSETITEDVTKTRKKSFKTHSRKKAKRIAGLLNRYSKHIAAQYGYDDLEAAAKGRKVKITLSKVVQVSRVVQRRGDGPVGNSGGTASDSNGMRGNDIDSGNW